MKPMKMPLRLQPCSADCHNGKLLQFVWHALRAVVIADGRTRVPVAMASLSARSCWLVAFGVNPVECLHFTQRIGAGRREQLLWVSVPYYGCSQCCRTMQMQATCNAMLVRITGTHPSLNATQPPPIVVQEATTNDIKVNNHRAHKIHLTF